MFVCVLSGQNTFNEIAIFHLIKCHSNVPDFIDFFFIIKIFSEKILKRAHE